MVCLFSKKTFAMSLVVVVSNHVCWIGNVGNNLVGTGALPDPSQLKVWPVIY